MFEKTPQMQNRVQYMLCRLKPGCFYPTQASLHGRRRRQRTLVSWEPVLDPKTNI